jgi:hypothetical protein
MSKFYLLDNNYNIFTGFELSKNGQKMYCYNCESDFRKASFFRSIDQIITYFQRAKMPLFSKQHKILEETSDNQIIYHNI